MSAETAEIVICGAGIAGIAAAYHLTVRQGVRDVLLIDERPPLTLTSDKSTECYRNWWPGPGDEMIRFMNRSIDLLEGLAEESDNFFGMNRRGYIFLTADPQQAEQMYVSAQEISRLGAGPLRVHSGSGNGTPYVKSPAHGYQGQPTGADLILDADLIQEHYPFLPQETVALLHARRCGWLSAQQLGMYLWGQAKAHGARLLTGRLTDVTLANGRVHSAHVQTGEGGQTIRTRTFLIASGPYLRETGKMIGIDLPVYNELHGKIAFDDVLGVVPRDLPLMIWEDPVTLPWTEAERAELAADPETRWLTRPLPAGVHFRPEGGPGSQTLLVLWTYDLDPHEPVWPPSFDPEYPEIVMRGLARMVPGLGAYLERMPRPYIDGGYYCKTRENRLLASPLPVEGAFVIGALSGYGIMASMAAGELVAAHICGTQLPDYAPYFHLDRYADPTYQQLLSQLTATAGQL